MRDPAHTKSVGLLLVAALCWSLAGVLFKYVEWPGLAAAGGRGLIAALFLAGLCWRQLRFTWSPLQLGAAVAYAACTILFTLANKMTTAANAILLQYTAPIWIALLGFWLLGERTTRADWFTIGAVLGGLVLFFYEGLQLNNVAGLLVALASGAGFAVMTIMMRKQKTASPLESIILGNLLGFVVGIPSLLHAPLLPASGWLALGLLGVVQLGLAYFLYARAIRHVTALEAVLIPVMEPVLNPVWVLLAVGERPGPLALAGGAIVLAAVTLRAILAIRPVS
ncbi:MAG TPA: DMT family transporter [Lacunisphaera sp.]|nr:DMT family transporter [Lacunisphaera sp.]